MPPLAAGLMLFCCVRQWWLRAFVRDSAGSCALRARVDGAAGPPALGAKGSARDRLTPPGRVEGSALGRYEAPLRWRGTAPLWAPFYMPPLAAKTFTTGLRPRKTGRPRFARGNAFPLWWLAPPPCPVGSMSLDSRVAGLPYESSSFATPASGGTMGT